MSPDRYLAKRIKYRLVANPAVIADRDLPRVCDLYRWPDQNVLPDPCAKNAQQETPPAETYLR
jgi:hypothetical protein